MCFEEKSLWGLLPSSAAEGKFGRRKCPMFGFRRSDSAPECCMVLHAIRLPKLSWPASSCAFLSQHFGQVLVPHPVQKFGYVSHMLQLLQSCFILLVFKKKTCWRFEAKSLGLRGYDFEEELIHFSLFRSFIFLFTGGKWRSWTCFYVLQRFCWVEMHASEKKGGFDGLYM